MDAAEQWCGASELLSRELLGGFSMSLSMASATWLWNHSARTWDATTLHALGLRATRLPQVAEAPGTVVKAYAARYPALASALFFPAVGDGALANLGSGATSPDVLAVLPDSHGLTVLPYLAGQRTPDWYDDATAAIEGLNFAQTRAQIARAFFEAMAFDFRRVFADLTVFLGPLLADVLGVPIEASDVAEASLRSAALYALQRLGTRLPPETTTGQTFYPLPERTRVYARVLVRQRAFSVRLRR